jgi:hypothetical protein
MANLTGRTIITSALRKARVLTKGEAPDADEVSDGLRDLNAMVNSWANLTLLSYARLSESFPVQAGVAEYTVGPGGDFATARPTHIVSAYVRIGGIDYALSPMSDTYYDNAYSTKDTPGYPERYLYVADNPLGKITLYPVPIAAGTIHIRSEKAIGNFDLDTEIELPEGWERALVFNLAIEVAPDYGQNISPEAASVAAKAKDALERNTSRNRKWTTPPLTQGATFNVNSGQY